MPADDSLSLLEEVVLLEPWAVASNPVDHPVVEFDEQQVQLGDEGGLVVAGVADERPLLRTRRIAKIVARQVVLVLDPFTLVVYDPANKQLHTVRIGLVVEVWSLHRTPPVERVEVEARGA